LAGYDLTDSKDLFDEKIRLLLQLTREEEPVWQGRTRPALNGQVVWPRALQNPLPVWLGVGGSPKSAIRAGELGAPMFLSVFTRTGPSQIELYRRAAQQAGHDPASLHTGSGGHMYVGRSSQKAKGEFFPYYSEYVKLNPALPYGMPRSMYDQSRRPSGRRRRKQNVTLCQRI